MLHADDDDAFQDALEMFDEDVLLPDSEEGADETANPAQAAAAGHAPSAAQAFASGKDWPLHRAAFAGDVEELQAALVGVSNEQLAALDPQGHSALHVAVLRRHKACVDALLQAGALAGLRSARGWAPVYTAVELRDRDLALQLLTADSLQVKADVKAKKAAVLKKLWELPDFSTQLQWELSSSVPGVGLLLRRYAPHDTYTIWKKGCRIRVDGSLMGVREGGQSLLPEWKTGHFSLLYNGSGGGENGKPLAVFVNRTKQKYVDLQAARKRVNALQDTAVAREVDDLMAQPQVMSRKVKASEFRFKPASGWLTKEVNEKVDGWNTKLYEASGGMMSVTKYKAPFRLAADATWEDYLATVPDEDVIVQEALNPLSGKMFSDKPATAPAPGDKAQHGDAKRASATRPAGREAAAGASRPENGVSEDAAPEPTNGHLHYGTPGAEAGSSGSKGPPPTAAASSAKDARKLTGKCWMAEGFPLSLQQLLPLLEVVGSANKHIAKVSRFLSKYGNLNLFPVKIQVPIVFTIYALLQFKKFRLACPTDAPAAAAAAGSNPQASKQAGGSFFKRNQSTSSTSSGTAGMDGNGPLPDEFFEVPAGYVKYVPKMLDKAQEHLQKQLAGEPEDVTQLDLAV